MAKRGEEREREADGKGARTYLTFKIAGIRVSSGMRTRKAGRGGGIRVAQVESLTRGKIRKVGYAGCNMQI